jgi:hypothetical protein
MESFPVLIFFVCEYFIQFLLEVVNPAAICFDSIFLLPFFLSCVLEMFR